MFSNPSFMVLFVNLALLIFNIEVSEGRLLMIPKQHTNNVIEDAVDNGQHNTCKV